MLMDEVSSQELGTSFPEEFQQVWKGIWKIWTPNRICHFIWHSARDSLPIKLSLRAQHLPVEDTCELCRDFQETTLHSLWLCEHAQVVWKSNINFVLYYKKGFRTFFDLLEEVLHKGSKYHVASFSTMAWCLWQRRNRLQMNQSVWPLHEIGDRAKGLVIEFFDTNKQEARSRVQSPPVRWVPPEGHSYKVNYDAAIFDLLGYAGLGVVIRDCIGHVIASLS